MTARIRRTAPERRKQLIGIGLRMLTARPIHQITIDDVAKDAGISRSLLFHYFPTKQDYYVEVVRAASRRLLRAARADPGAARGDQVRTIVEGYVTFIERRRTQYVGLFRTSGPDAWIQAIHDETQDALTSRVIEAMGGTARGEAAELAIRAWWAFTEELAIEWAAHGRQDRDALVSLAVSTLHHVVSTAEGA
ncbi:MAG: TetR/AcrR family transcriptional regulator [Actinomycetota bacterium]|nr:TetR/AcrR family transcriptional regulator [Actinomycetota bacterium]